MLLWAVLVCKLHILKIMKIIRWDLMAFLLPCTGQVTPCSCSDLYCPRNKCMLVLNTLPPRSPELSIWGCLRGKDAEFLGWALFCMRSLCRNVVSGSCEGAAAQHGDLLWGPCSLVLATRHWGPVQELFCESCREEMQADMPPVVWGKSTGYQNPNHWKSKCVLSRGSSVSAVEKEESTGCEKRNFPRMSYMVQKIFSQFGAIYSDLGMALRCFLCNNPPSTVWGLQSGADL